MFVVPLIEIEKILGIYAGKGIRAKRRKSYSMRDLLISHT
jgi:hypothetical protein